MHTILIETMRIMGRSQLGYLELSMFTYAKQITLKSAE